VDSSVKYNALKRGLYPRPETDHFNGQTCLEFLQQLYRRSRRPDRQIVVIADYAQFHYATLHQPWRDAHGQRFALDFQPPYSPELNPIERVWKLTRRKRLHRAQVITHALARLEHAIYNSAAPGPRTHE